MSRLGQDCVNGGDDEALSNAHKHARSSDGARVERGLGRQQTGQGPEREGDDQHDVAAVALCQEATWHLPDHQATSQAEHMNT